MTGFRGKVVVVTGAARGLRDTGREVEGRGRRCTTGLPDVSDPRTVAAAVATGVAELGRLDVVVANGAHRTQPAAGAAGLPGLRPGRYITAATLPIDADATRR